MTMTDFDLKEMIVDALDFEPSVNAAHVGVIVKDGIVTLTGHVPTFAEKTTAEQVVARIKGVRGIAQEITVRPAGTALTADDEIARRSIEVLRWNTSVPHEQVQVKVAQGWLTLSGQVPWHFHREAAERALRGLAGVVGITNALTVVPSASQHDVRSRIEEALKRDAELQANAIRVSVADGTVTLEGRVNSLTERRIAERAAWAGAGVRRVDDRLTIG
jgi:osmotically-inducible protein OsmY